MSNPDEVPDRWAIVTGANGGLGRYVTRGLAQEGFKVVLATRNVKAGQIAAAFVKESLPDATLKVMKLDLASLESIADFAFLFQELSESVDVLVNNAGIMGGSYFTTEDGFEAQIGVNHFGHFALTARLMPALRRAKRARVVTVSSLMARFGRIDFSSFQSDFHYRQYRAYSQSKLANQLFTKELSRRLATGGRGMMAMAAHPGYSSTNLMYGPDPAAVSSATRGVMEISSKMMAQQASDGAESLLFAALSEDVKPGGYYGPTGAFGLKGPVGEVPFVKRASDTVVSRRLFEVSSELTKVSFDI
ncbi:MAG: SDR family NAD(P)-dependent oxidoreductase [Acidimicrobiaceae bacterium]|nr:SDR family NAD(P)-dependent oxidoreductase [Acidimicrobiaceae bacterium]